MYLLPNRPVPARQSAFQMLDHRDTGALVISLDFELLWGLKDLFPADGGSLRDSILGARTVIPRILDLFEEFDIAATWATVGLLFAHDRAEQERFFPSIKPTYEDPRLSTYQYPVGSDEDEDPLHFAPSLIRLIRKHKKQEIGTHTFSHYYCLEPGQSADAFRADLTAAVAIATRYDIELRSIVFPRNQHNPNLDPVLIDAGLTSFRGTRTYWPDRGVENTRYFQPPRRIGRLLDTYLPIDRHNSTPWNDVLQENGLANIPANRFMGPRLRTLERRRINRVVSEMEAAAKAGRIYHIWWHPFNFGVNQPANLTLLRVVLEAAAMCRDRYGLQSLSMADVTDIARTRKPSNLATGRRDQQLQPNARKLIGLESLRNASHLTPEARKSP